MRALVLLLLALRLVAQDERVEVLARPPLAGTPCYTGHRAPLAPDPLIELPCGAVRASGWLATQLTLMRDGMFGHLPELSRFCRDADNAWLSKSGEGKLGWEELPYWLRGLTSLAHLTRDERLLAETKKWIDAVLASQREDGWFGPESNRQAMDIWPNMLVCRALRTHFEATGDARVIPFLLKYCAWQAKAPNARFLHGSWQKWRGADNLLIVHWLYDQTGESWLLDLAKKTHEQTADWMHTIPTWHGVNICQGFREPAQWSVQSRDPAHVARSEAIYQDVYARYGQMPGGMFAADENCRPGYADPRQGAEACSMVEMMYSQQILLGISGDPGHADRCEDVAFNSLPAAVTDDMKALRYLTAPNLVSSDAGNKHPGFDNGGCMLAFSADERYRCCQHNVVMGWPYFIEHLWMATRDGGLAAVMHAPCVVEAKVAGCGSVRIECATEYPFGDALTYTVHPAKQARCALWFRIPGWCERAQLRINGGAREVPAKTGAWLRVEREWRDGDTLELRVPATLGVRRWPGQHGAASVQKGPLTYALAIDEDWRRAGGTERWADFEVLPGGDWSYALELGDKSVRETRWNVAASHGLDRASFHSRTSAMAAFPEVKAKARKVPGWRMRGGLAGRLQDSPIESPAPVEEIGLIPMGCARLRISMFPVLGDGPAAHAWQAEPEPPSASHVHDDPQALCDGIWPASSDDYSIPRFTWWDHKGTTEWAQRDFDAPKEVGECTLYFFDDEPRGGGCRVPESWRVLWKDGEKWEPVTSSDAFGTAKDTRHRVRFAKITTRALRLEVKLRSGFSGGVLEWEVK